VQLMKTARLTSFMSKANTFLITKKYFPLYWIVIAVLILRADYLTGRLVQFPILFLIPIGFASWYNGRTWGSIFAFSMPLVRLHFLTLWGAPWTIYEATINALIRISVFIIFAFLVDRVGKQKRDLEKEVRTLKGILPICSFCKKIRNKKENWVTIEDYIKAHSEADFSHGMCPECAKNHYPDYFKN
jgi:hypothetical protein